MRYKYTLGFFMIFSFLMSCDNKVHSKDKSEHSTVDSKSAESDSTDIAAFNKIIEFAQKNNLQKKSLPEIEIALAKYFLGTPYVAHTLEKEGNEQLVINLRQMDCTTFVENIVSLSKCVKTQKTDFNDFRQTLAKFRYRGGKIDKYPSRLHYFTDWLLDGEKKQLVSIVSNTFAEEDFDSKVNFMSTHSGYYKQLKNPAFLKQIEKTEKQISKVKLKFIAKQNIHLYEQNIKNGDIIAITSSIKGLDIAHVGIAYFVDNRLHLIHASSGQKKVVISQLPLEDYLKQYKKKDGIIVGRLTTGQNDID